MLRRDFLRLAGLLPFGSCWLDTAWGSVLDPGAADGWDRTLVLLELSGGNDGLNTVVPCHDPVYHQLRPTLAIPAAETLPLDAELGLNPALAPLLPLWKDGDLAILRGVGYPRPNRSHFRSIEIWETGSASDRNLFDGWVTRLYALSPPGDDCVARGLVLGKSDAGPLGGESMRDVLVMNDPTRIPAPEKEVRDGPMASTNPALAHILAVRRDLARSLGRLEEKLAGARPLRTAFPPRPLGAGFQAAARLIGAGIKLPVIKISQTSYDHHANQRGQHDNLLAGLAECLAAFRTAMLELGRWNDVLVLTYAEFGRRVAENGSRGTDHGTAAPHFALGGSVVGGFHGAQPSLTDLDEGDLKFTTDYRDVYATVARRWFGVLGPFLPDFKERPLGFLA